MKSATKTRRSKLLLFAASAFLPLVQPVIASQQFGGSHLAINLDAPIDIRNCIDGESFSAKVTRTSLNLPENTTLIGHIRTVTPDSRAPSYKRIELCFETLQLAGEQIPVNCRLAPRENSLEVTHEGKKMRLPTMQFRAPIKTEITSYCVMGMSAEHLKKFQARQEKAREYDLKTNKENDAWNKRYDLTNSNQILFQSTRTTPFRLETTDRLSIRVNPPVEIADFPPAQ